MSAGGETPGKAPLPIVQAVATGRLKIIDYRIDVGRGQRQTTGGAGRSHQAVFCLEHGDRGELPGSVDLVDRLPIAAAQRRGSRVQVRRAQRKTSPHHLRGELVGQLARTGPERSGVRAGHALRLGVHVSHAPHRSRLGDVVQHHRDQILQARCLLRVGFWCRARDRAGDHVVDRNLGAQYPGRLLAPLRAALGEGGTLLLAGARRQGGLLGEAELRCPRRLVPVLGAVGAHQLVVGVLDRRTARGERLTDAGVDALDLPDRARPTGAHLIDEPHPESLDELGLHARVVPLGCGNAEQVQDPPIQGTPLAVSALDLVGHREVGVQIRVARARVEVIERGCHQALGVDLSHPARAHTRQCGLGLDPHQRGPPRALVGLLDLSAHPLVAQTPQGRDGLDRCEHQVVTRDRLALCGAARGEEPGHRSLGGRTRRGLGEQGPGHVPTDQVALDTDLRGAVMVRAELGERRREGLRVRVVDGRELRKPAPELGGLHRLDGAGPTGHQGARTGIRIRVAPLTEQGLHLLLGHLAGHAQTRQPLPHPAAGRVAVGHVVIAQ